MTSDKLFEVYQAFCFIIVTFFIVLALLYFVTGFVQGIIKAIRRHRQARESRRYLKQVFTHMDEVRSEPGKWQPYYKLMVAPDYSLWGNCMYRLEWTDEVGTIAVCVIHGENSRHQKGPMEDIEGWRAPCLALDPYPEKIEVTGDRL